MGNQKRELHGIFEQARFTISFEEGTTPPSRLQSPIVDRAVMIEIANLAAGQAVRLYAETHPRPTQVTRAQAAEMLGVSTKTVSRYIRFGSLKLNSCGRIPTEAVDRLRSN